MHRTSLRRRIVPCVLLVAACSGCVPFHYQDNPAIHGAIVDAKSRAPIPEATVTLRRTSDGVSLASASSGSDGRFSIPAADHLGLWAIGGDVFEPPLILSVSDARYVTVQGQIDPWKDWDGTIKLSPVVAVP